MIQTIAKFGSYTLGFCEAVVILAGCASPTTPAITQARVGSFAPSFIRPMHAVSFGAADPLRHTGNETMAAKSASGHCGEGDFRDYVELSASGRATGPYPGTFSLVTLANVNSCPGSGGTYFTQTFTITSRAETLTGTASGVASYHCPVHFNCYLDAAVGWKYSATLIRDGRVLKTFSGSASESGKPFAETLNGL